MVWGQYIVDVHRCGWLVPLGWLANGCPVARRTSTTYIDVFRDMYEAFTIYNFLKLLIVLLGGEKSVIDILNTKPQMRLLFPLGWMEPWEMGAELFYGTKYPTPRPQPILPPTARASVDRGFRTLVIFTTS